jgi:hypothetical protein
MAISAGYNSGLLQSVVAKEGIIIRFKNYCNVYLQKTPYGGPRERFQQNRQLCFMEKNTQNDLALPLD